MVLTDGQLNRPDETSEGRINRKYRSQVAGNVWTSSAPSWRLAFASSYGGVRESSRRAPYLGAYPRRCCRTPGISKHATKWCRIVEHLRQYRWQGDAVETHHIFVVLEGCFEVK